MSKAHDGTTSLRSSSEEDIPLRELHPRGRPSADSTYSSDFDRLLSDNGSSVSSTDLPPVDGGRGAWTFLFGTWLLEATLWAFALSFGVFQEYYSKHELFRDSDLIPTIGALATGITYLALPLTNPIVMKWPQYRREMVVVGYSMCLVGLVGASFAREAWQLLVFQGLFFAVGWVICYTPFLFMLNEWFVEKRGLAYGILFCASGFSGLFIPLAVGASLERFGFRNTLRGTPAGHHHGSTSDSKGQNISTLLKYCKSIHLPVFASAVFLQGFAFFLPNIFMPSFAKDLGLSSTESSGLLALISLAQVFGQLFQGWISDRVNIYILASISTLVPGLAAVLLWGPAKDKAYLAPFALIWGFFSSSYTVLLTRMCTTVIDRDEDERMFMLLYGILSVMRGLSNVLEGPLSSWLIGEEVDTESFGLGRYIWIVWFTSLSMLASSFVGLGWFWRKRT